MDEQDKTIEGSKTKNVQLLEIKPAPNGMSFSAQLEKFYLNSELLSTESKAVKPASALEPITGMKILKQQNKVQ